jgi:hypothetical protein
MVDAQLFLFISVKNYTLNKMCSIKLVFMPIHILRKTVFRLEILCAFILSLTH